MLTVYLDTNVYIVGLLYPKTNSALILRESSEGKFNVAQSDYFVTANMKLGQMKIKDKVNFKTPREFVKDILELEDYFPEDI